MAQSGALLLGRKTYLDFFSVWPNLTDNPYTEVLNNSRKYVVLRTLNEPLPWMNSTLLRGDPVESVGAIKKKPGKDLVVLGSGELLQTLMKNNLVDEYVLQIAPVVLGSGRRLFNGGGPHFNLQLVDTKTTTTGVVIGTYRPARALAS